MKRLTGLLSALVLLGFVGCGSDIYINKIEDVKQQLKSAKDHLENIQKVLDTAAGEYAKDPKLSWASALKPAIERANDLKKVGNELGETKRKIDNMPKPTDEQNAQFAQEFSSDFKKRVDDLINAQKKMNESLDKVAAINSKAVEELRKKLREAEGAFELVRSR